jgi:hypothetical protein
MHELKTPVSFFVFNRPKTTAIVFEQIRRARPTRLLLIADGPRPDRVREAEECNAVRAIIEQVDWPCEVMKNYANTNMGCKRRMSSGLDWVFQCVEESIILEDDCVPDQSFFRFCEMMLEKYRDDRRVMQIGGSNLIAEKMNIEESYYFSYVFSIWGWATWRRAWSLYDIEMLHYPKFRNYLPDMFVDKRIAYWIEYAMDKVFYENVDTWDIQWAYTCAINNGLQITPKNNLISNIGNDGTHFKNARYSFLNQINKAIDLNNIIHPPFILPNDSFLKLHYDYFLNEMRSFYYWWHLVHLLKKMNLYRFARRIYRSLKRRPGQGREPSAS